LLEYSKSNPYSLTQEKGRSTSSRQAKSIAPVNELTSAQNIGYLAGDILA